MSAATRRELLERATQRLEEAGVEHARRNAEWMLEEAVGTNRAALIARLDQAVTVEERKVFEGMVARRLRRVPLQYVVGHADFSGLRLVVNPSVLIPRPETEELVEALLGALDAVAAPWVLDVGTGSGAIALALKRARPDAEVFACDVSREALDVAAENAERLGLDVQFVLADALRPAFADGVPTCFDALVANPPYVPDDERATLEPEVRDHEPALALFTGADVLRFYRALAGHAGRILKEGGLLVVEAHVDHAGAVRELFEEAGLCDVHLRQDLAGRDRIVRGRRPVSVDGGPGTGDGGQETVDRQ